MVIVDFWNLWKYLNSILMEEESAIETVILLAMCQMDHTHLMNGHSHLAENSNSLNLKVLA